MVSLIEGWWCVRGAGVVPRCPEMKGSSTQVFITVWEWVPRLGKSLFVTNCLAAGFA